MSDAVMTHNRSMYLDDYGGKLCSADTERLPPEPVLTWNELVLP